MSTFQILGIKTHFMPGVNLGGFFFENSSNYELRKMVNQKKKHIDFVVNYRNFEYRYHVMVKKIIKIVKNVFIFLLIIIYFLIFDFSKLDTNILQSRYQDDVSFLYRRQWGVFLRKRMTKSLMLFKLNLKVSALLESSIIRL